MGKGIQAKVYLCKHFVDFGNRDMLGSPLGVGVHYVSKTMGPVGSMGSVGM